MRIPLVAGNWKMNGTRASVTALAGAIASGCKAGGPQVVLCAPAIYLGAVAEVIAGSSVMLGAQNLSDQDAGAYTGEISGPMLRDMGARYVIVGHSERRRIYGETDALVAEKFEAARRCGLAPIVCVGETLAEREAGATQAVVRRQLETVINLNKLAEFEDAVVAYEPVWAIGTGRTATPAQAQEVQAFVRALVASRDRRIADGLRILYGGSVRADNAAALLAQADVDGALVGSASLDAGEFLMICAAAAARVKIK
jgi:triosephosphate isomerase